MRNIRPSRTNQRERLLRTARFCCPVPVLSVLFLVSIAGCRPEPGLVPFSSDGCSLFPDAALITADDWCTCCFDHDVAYWRGGTAEEREQADRALKRCVIDKTQNEALATLMYEGVRFGGSPYFYNWYRWGYGWPFDRKYQPLTDAEHSRADDLLADYVADDSGDVCR